MMVRLWVSRLCYFPSFVKDNYGVCRQTNGRISSMALAVRWSLWICYPNADPLSAQIAIIDDVISKVASGKIQ